MSTDPHNGNLYNHSGISENQLDWQDLKIAKNVLIAIAMAEKIYPV